MINWLTYKDNNSRLLDEQGIHHGAEKKTDVGVDADKGVHKKAAVGTEQAGTEHKGLGEKIKGEFPLSRVRCDGWKWVADECGLLAEKLHLGHH